MMQMEAQENNVDVEDAVETDQLLVVEEKEEQDEEDENDFFSEADEEEADDGLNAGMDAWFHTGDAELDDHEASPLIAYGTSGTYGSANRRRHLRGTLPVGSWYWRALVRHNIDPLSFRPVQTIYRLKLQAAIYICILFCAATFQGVYEWNPLIQLVYFTCACCPNYMFGLFVYRAVDALLLREHFTLVNLRPSALSPFLERLVDPQKSRHVIFVRMQALMMFVMVVSFVASTIYLYSRYA